MSAIILGVALAVPASAETALDGSAWLMQGKSIFSPKDRVTFCHGQFVRRSAVRAGQRPAPYDVHDLGNAVVWTAREPAPKGGMQIWEGVWDRRTAVMTVSCSYPSEDGSIKSREWRMRRFAQ